MSILEKTSLFPLLLWLFAYPRFFEEVRPVRLYRRIGNRDALVCPQLPPVSPIPDVFDQHECQRGQADQRQYPCG